MIEIKAQKASNSPAIAYRDVGNAEIDYFGLKLIGHDFCRGSFINQGFADQIIVSGHRE